MVVCKTKQILNCFSFNCVQKQLSSLVLPTLHLPTRLQLKQLLFDFVYTLGTDSFFFLFSPLPPRLAGQKSVIKEPLLEALSSVTTCFTAVYHCRLCSSLKAGSYVFTSTSTGEALGSSLSAQQLQTYQPPKSLKIEGRNFNKGITGSIFSNKSNIPFSQLQLSYITLYQVEPSNCLHFTLLIIKDKQPPLSQGDSHYLTFAADESKHRLSPEFS